MRWTPHMDEALQLISMSKACPADELFVLQIRLHLLKQEADDVRRQDETDIAENAPIELSAPRLLYLNTLRRRLHELRSSFRPGLSQLG